MTSRLTDTEWNLGVFVSRRLAFHCDRVNGACGRQERCDKGHDTGLGTEGADGRGGFELGVRWRVYSVSHHAVMSAVPAATSWKLCF